MEVAQNDESEDESEDGDEPVPVRGPLFGTETMAELCVRQGRVPDAVAIYRSLLATAAAGASGAEGDEERRERWSDRLTALQSPGAARRPAAALSFEGPSAAAVAVQSGSPSQRITAPPAPTRPVRPALLRSAAPGNADLANRAASAGRPALGAAPRGAIHRLPVIIREPVRAGQIVYAEKNDLIVVGPVNPGAQLIADGNIHVYGRLRGRAVAGAHGAREARIYCQRLEAELVGIDSAYLIADDIPPERYGLSVQVFWQDGRCVVAPL